MARPKNRKRRCADEPAQDNRSTKRLRANEAKQSDRTAKRKRPHVDEPSRAAKKVRPTTDDVPPSFFDNLSKVSLTQRALKELDRRNHAHPSSRLTRPDVYPKSLARFARHGGPDIAYLRGVCSHCTRRREPPTNCLLSIPNRKARLRWRPAAHPGLPASGRDRSIRRQQAFLLRAGSHPHMTRSSRHTS